MTELLVNCYFFKFICYMTEDLQKEVLVEWVLGVCFRMRLDCYGRC